MAINVDTNAVRTTAKQISDTNRNISDDFSPVESAISDLRKNWSGNASSAVIGKFDKIKKDYCDDRFKVINDMTNFLRNQVGDGYEVTEATIVSAASAFK